jgi:hypothetical protein
MQQHQGLHKVICETVQNAFARRHTSHPLLRVRAGIVDTDRTMADVVQAPHRAQSGTRGLRANLTPTRPQYHVKRKKRLPLAARAL